MILASASPRRRELLEEEGFELDIRPADINEAPLAGELPEDYVERVACAKARAVRLSDPTACAGQLLLAADTIVWVDGPADGVPQLLGKPADDDDARHMLQELSGRWHHVSTGVCIFDERDPASPFAGGLSFVETTDVKFFKLTEQQIEWYVATGEPHDKAGAYGIQGRGRRLVQGIRGDFYNVIGLPISRLMRILST